MRESFSGTTLFIIVIFFVVLFAGYLCLSINQTRAFNVKNSVVRVVERYGVGVDSIGDLARKTDLQNDIGEELNDVGYRTQGFCDTSSNVQGFNALGQPDDVHPVICIEYVPSGILTNNPSNNLHYFRVTTFYHFDLPIFRSVFRLTIKGDTKPMM